MKVGIDVSQAIFVGTAGAGSATYTRALVSALVEQDDDTQYALFGGSLRRKKDLEVFATSLTKPVERYFTNLPPVALNILWNEFHKVPIERFTGKLDVFHASDATQPPAKAKKVTTIHDLVVFKYPETLQPTHIRLQNRRLDWVKKEADAVIAVSEATKQDIMQYLDVPEEKIHVVYEGVSEEFRPKEQLDSVYLDRVRQKYRLPDAFLLNIGTLQPRKNLPRLIEAYLLAKPPMPLLIVGADGWGEQLKQTDNVRLLGRVPQEDLAGLYALAHTFIYPSLYEGFGLPILEAMASGTPVVTSNTSSMKEVGGNVAMLVDPMSTHSIAQAIESLTNLHAEELQKHKEQGIQWASQFTWEKTAQQTRDVYYSIV